MSNLSKVNNPPEKQETKRIIIVDENSTVDDLRRAMLVNFNALQEGSLDRNVAQELNNMAGKLISMVKEELEEMKMTKKIKEIPFLQYDKKKKLE